MMSSVNILLLALLPCAALPAGALEKLREQVQRIAAEHSAFFNTSFSIGLVVGGERISGVGGLANHRTGEAATTASLYPVGSATKLYTAVACLQLAERGQLDLDQPLHQIVDPFLHRTNGTTLLKLWHGNPQINAITTRQVLAMRGGLNDYDDSAVRAWSLDRANEGKDLTPYDYIDSDGLVPKGFLFAPDKGGSYSSIGFELAGLVLAALSNASSWRDYDQRSILPDALKAAVPGFQFPLGGPCTNYSGVTAQYTPGMVEGPGDARPWTTVGMSDISWGSCLDGWTFGNLVAAPADLAEVLYNVFSPAAPHPLLSEDSVRQMTQFKPLTTGFATGLPYGLGTMRYDAFEYNMLPPPAPGVDPKLGVLVGHAGEDYGSEAPLHHYNAEADTSVVVALNSVSGMNCSLPSFAANFYAGNSVFCALWDAVLAATGKAAAGSLRCGGRSGAGAAAANFSRTNLTTLLARPPVAALGTGSAAQPPIPMYHCPVGPRCSGSSSRLDPAECDAWRALHSTAGGIAWRWCSASFDDPCGCSSVQCSADGAHITGLSLASHTLIGALPSQLAALTQLRRLDLRNNSVYGALPRLNFSSSLAGACQLDTKAFSCPLPPGASECRAPSQPAVECDSPFPPLSPACLRDIGKLALHPGVAAMAAGFYQALGSIERGMAGYICPAELAANHSCSLPINWTATAKGAAFIAKFRKTLTAIDPTAQLCLSDVSQETIRMDTGDVSWFNLTVQQSALWYATGNCTAADRAKYMAWAGTMPRCANRAALDCKLSLGPGYEYCAGAEEARATSVSS